MTLGEIKARRRQHQNEDRSRNGRGKLVSRVVKVNGRYSTMLHRHEIVGGENK